MVSTEQLTMVLLITAGVFLFFIAIAVIKMYKLKAENKRLTEMDAYKSDVDTSYKDFTDSHLYDNK
jgi:putative copper export protein